MLRMTNMISRITITIPMIAWGMLIHSVNSQAGPYEDCVLDNMRGAKNKAAVYSIQTACLDKSTPRKCRDYLPQHREKSLDIPLEAKGLTGMAYWRAIADHAAQKEQFFENKLKECLNRCTQSGYWDKMFGECSTD